MTRFFKPFSIALSALLVCAFVVAGCGSKSSSSSDQPPAEAIQTALTKTSELDSGNATLKGSLALSGIPGSLAITGGGPFDTKAKGGPAYKLELSINVAGSPQQLGFMAVDGKNYMLVGDKALEQKKGASGALQAGQIANFIKELGDYLSNAKKTGDNTYTADVNVKKLFTDNSDKAGGLSNLQIPGLGGGKELAKSLGTANVTISIDPQGYADTIDLNLPITSNGNEGGLKLKIGLDEINQPQTIEPPADVVKSPSELGGLGAAFGAN